MKATCEIFIYNSSWTKDSPRFSALCNILSNLYCGYKYTRPCMINRIWGLKQLWLQVNGHASFHLHGLCWPVLNGEGAKNSKWKYWGWFNFRGVPIFVVFVEGLIHEFQYPRICEFSYQLWRKILSHEFWTPRMCHFRSIHENWYPRN